MTLDEREKIQQDEYLRQLEARHELMIEHLLRQMTRLNAEIDTRDSVIVQMQAIAKVHREYIQRLQVELHEARCNRPVQHQSTSVNETELGLPSPTVAGPSTSRQSSAQSSAAAPPSQQVLDSGWYLSLCGMINNLDEIPDAARDEILKKLKEAKKFVKGVGGSSTQTDPEVQPMEDVEPQQSPGSASLYLGFKWNHSPIIFNGYRAHFFNGSRAQLFLMDPGPNYF